MHRNDPPKRVQFCFSPTPKYRQNLHTLSYHFSDPPLTIKIKFKILSPQKRFEPKYTCSLYGNIRVNPPPWVHTLPGRKYRVPRSCFATYLATMSYNEPSEHVKSGIETVRQFIDKHFEDSSPTELKTVHRQNFRQFINKFYIVFIWNVTIFTIFYVIMNEGLK